MKRFPFSFFHSVHEIPILTGLLHAFLSTEEIPMVSVEFHSLTRPAPALCCCSRAQSSPSLALPKKYWQVLLGGEDGGPDLSAGLAWLRNYGQSWELPLQTSGRAQQPGEAVSCGERRCKEQVLAASWGRRPNLLCCRPGCAPADTSKGDGYGFGHFCSVEKINREREFCKTLSSKYSSFFPMSFEIYIGM